MRKGVDMINGIGSTGGSRVDLTRTDAANRGSVARTADAVDVSGPAGVNRPTNTGADMAALGAPINAEKIAAIRSAIAEGRYPVNPKAIAEKMIALDLPLKF